MQSLVMQCNYGLKRVFPPPFSRLEARQQTAPLKTKTSEGNGAAVVAVLVVKLS